MYLQRPKATSGVVNQLLYDCKKSDCRRFSANKDYINQRSGDCRAAALRSLIYMIWQIEPDLELLWLAAAYYLRNTPTLSVSPGAAQSIFIWIVSLYSNLSDLNIISTKPYLLLYWINASRLKFRILEWSEISYHSLRAKNVWSVCFQAPAKGRDPNPSGLGRAIINKKVKDARRMQESGLVRSQRTICL